MPHHNCLKKSTKILPFSPYYAGKCGYIVFKNCLIKLAYLLCRGHQTFIFCRFVGLYNVNYRGVINITDCKQQTISTSSNQWFLWKERITIKMKTTRKTKHNLCLCYILSIDMLDVVMINHDCYVYDFRMYDCHMMVSPQNALVSFCFLLNTWHFNHFVKGM